MIEKIFTAAMNQFNL